MRDQDPYSDLTDLFTAEDRKMDPAPFVNDVMAGIRRKSLFRRLLLGAVGMGGAAIAAIQLPSLLAGWTGLDTLVTRTVSNARQDASLLASADPVWLMVGGVVAFTLLALTSWERA